jgi:hypothetical protein
MRAFHPDDSGLLPAPDRQRREEEERERRRRQGNGGGQGLLSPFMPGDQQALAQQMTMGFGGNPQQIRGMLSQIYSPMRFGFKPGQGGGFGGGGFGGFGGNPQQTKGVTKAPYGVIGG